MVAPIAKGRPPSIPPRNFYTSKKKVPRRRRAYAPADSTPRALRYVESYLVGKDNRKVATAALLGCGLRTAAKISNHHLPFCGRFKFAWLYRLCAAVRKPIGRLLGIERSFPDALVGWIGAHTSQEAMQDASDLALAITHRAFAGFDLSGSAAFQHEGGRPAAVEVRLSSAPHMEFRGKEYSSHVIFVVADTAAGFMRLRYLHETTGYSYDKRLTMANLETLLKNIHALTKNVRAEIIREAAGRTTYAQR